MRPNNQFAGAVHILTLLHLKEGEPQTSRFISLSTGLNPVTVRKLLLTLKEAGCIATRKGSEGGALLARPAEEIRLGDVFRLFRPEALYGAYLAEPHPQCPVGRGLTRALEELLAPPRQAFIRELQAISLDQVTQAVVAAAQEGDESPPAGV